MQSIFILNWRCPRHPKSGGAEYVTFELAKRLVKAGYRLTWFAMRYPGAKKQEVMAGVKIIRQGGVLTVQRAARSWYRQHQSEIDLIIDQPHGLPFFSVKWARCPVLYYVNEVAGPIAVYMLPFPLGQIFSWLEPFFIKAYRHTTAVTISQSTTSDLKRFGYQGKIYTMPLACDTKPLIKLPALSTKEKNLTVVFAARLVPLKRPDHAIKMMSYLVKVNPKVQLWLLGSGERSYLNHLNRLVKQFGLQSQVKFWGFVDLKKRNELMQRAHLVTITSIKEGWGLTVPEANALGTVAVTYDIAGVRDSNLNGKTGLLTKTNNPQALAVAINNLYKDKKKYEELRKNAWELSKTRTWNQTYQVLRQALEAAQKSTTKSGLKTS